MFLKRAGMKSFSGPMLQGDFGAQNPSQFTIDNFFKAIAGETLEFEGTTIYREGEAKGILWGGNLATIASLCGQDFIPDEPFIFFTEDLNEPAYKIDKMFTQLFNIGQFRQNCKGVVLGDFIGADGADEIFCELPVPCVGGFALTHNADKITLPYGASATLIETVLDIG